MYYYYNEIGYKAQRHRLHMVDIYTTFIAIVSSLKLH